MRTIETDRLSGDLYVVNRDDEFSGLPDSLVPSVEKAFASHNITAVVAYRENYRDVPLHGVVPLEGDLISDGGDWSTRIATNIEEVIEMFVWSRKWFLEDKGIIEEDDE